MSTTPLLLNENERRQAAERVERQDRIVAEFERLMSSLASTIGERLEAALGADPIGATDLEARLGAARNADQLRVIALAVELRDVEAFVRDAGLDGVEDTWFARYGQLADAAERILKVAGVPNAATLLDGVAVQTTVDAMVERHSGLFDDLRTQSARRITEALHTQVGLVSHDELARRIADSEEVSFERAKTEAITRIAEADRVFMDEAVKAAEDGETEILLIYVGPYDARTRPFCRALVNKAFVRDELAGLYNGQTVVHPIHSCGGYRCRHMWVALPGGDLEGLPYVRGTLADIAAANAAGANLRKRRR